MRHKRINDEHSVHKVELLLHNLAGKEDRDARGNVGDADAIVGNVDAVVADAGVGWVARNEARDVLFNCPTLKKCINKRAKARKKGPKVRTGR